MLEFFVKRILDFHEGFVDIHQHLDQAGIAECLIGIFPANANQINELLFARNTLRSSAEIGCGHYRIPLYFLERRPGLARLLLNQVILVSDIAKTR